MESVALEVEANCPLTILSRAMERLEVTLLSKLDASQASLNKTESK